MRKAPQDSAIIYQYGENPDIIICCPERLEFCKKYFKGLKIECCYLIDSDLIVLTEHKKKSEIKFKVIANEQIV